MYKKPTPRCAKAEFVKQASSTLLQVLTDADVVRVFTAWEAQKARNATFKFIMSRLHWVETILYFEVAMLI